MAKLEPPGPRFEIAEADGELTITLWAKKNWWIIVPLVLMVAFALTMVLVAVFDPAQMGPPAPAQPPAPWPVIPFMILFGGFMLCMFGYLFLRLLGTVEKLLLKDETLTLRSGPLALSPAREFDLSYVRNLRYDPVGEVDWFRQVNWPVPRPRIAFDYGARTFRFGYDLDEPEAELLITMIRERLPSRGA